LGTDPLRELRKIKRESNMRNDCVIEIELEYAVRMVRSGFASAAAAARICGIPLTALETRLRAPARSSLADGTPSVVKGFWEHV
jgi:hypothetical protein